MKENLEFRFLSYGDIYDILKLTNEVNSKIQSKHVFSEDSREELHNILNLGGSFLGVFDGDELIAYRSVKLPDDDSNIAKYVKKFDIPFDKVLVNDAVVVREDYRGMQLQNKTREIMIEKFEGSKYTHRMGTVSPMNPPSYKNTIGSGYTVIALEKIYADDENPDGYYRFITHKSDDVEYNFTGRERKIFHEDIDDMRKALDENYYGVSADDDGYILFKEAEVKFLR